MPGASFWPRVTSFCLWSTSKRGKRGLGNPHKSEWKQRKMCHQLWRWHGEEQSFIATCFGRTCAACLWLWMSNVVVLGAWQWKKNNYIAASHISSLFSGWTKKQQEVLQLWEPYFCHSFIGELLFASALPHSWQAINGGFLWFSFSSLQMQNLGRLHRQAGGMSLRQEGWCLWNGFLKRSPKSQDIILGWPGKDWAPT